MRLINRLMSASQATCLCNDCFIATVWVQRMLYASASTGSSSSSKQEVSQEPQQQDSAATIAQPHKQQAMSLLFSVRPSVLSPLHALHREAEETYARMRFLEATMQAHFKLSEELHPDELKHHKDKSDPVAAALADRRQQLQEARSLYDRLRGDLTPCQTPDHMAGYYATLEAVLQKKDENATEFQKVLEGDRSVWDYWFQHFSPQYKGLPSLGSIEKIYNQADDEAVLRDIAGARVAAPKEPPAPKVDHRGRAAAMGGRKTSRAQVYLWRGQGRILINRQPLDAFFSDLLMRSSVLRPLAVTGLTGQIDAVVQVDGGGVSGQAQAAAHGIAKALRRLDPNLKPALKAAGLLKRDPRAVERKKPGKAKARKSFAWVKR